MGLTNKPHFVKKRKKSLLPLGIEIQFSGPLLLSVETAFLNNARSNQ